MFGDVIVPIDGSALSAQALDVGAALALANQSQLRVFAYTGSNDGMELDLWVRGQVDDVQNSFGLEPTVTIRAVDRFIADEIVSEVEAHPGAVVCMTSLGRGRSAALHGSVGREVLDRSSGPVVLCGPEYVRGQFNLGNHGPIVVAIDGTPESESILPIAEAFAIVFGLPLEIITVLSEKVSRAAALAYAAGDVTESGYVSSVARHAHEVTNKPVDFEVFHDKHPAHAIVAESKARNASFVAMATHARHGFDLLRSGSVTAEVVQHSTVPVLASRPITTNPRHAQH